MEIQSGDKNLASKVIIYEQPLGYVYNSYPRVRHILTWAISYKCYHSQKALTTISYPDEQTNTKPLLDMGVDNVTESGAICKITNIQETLELAKTIDTTIDKPIAPAELYNTKMSTIERDRQTQIETETPVETEGRIDIQLTNDQNQNDNENKSAEDAESVEDVEDFRKCRRSRFIKFCI